MLGYGTVYGTIRGRGRVGWNLWKLFPGSFERLLRACIYTIEINSLQTKLDQIIQIYSTARLFHQKCPMMDCHV